MENENNTAKTAAATNNEQSTVQTESKAAPSFEELLKNKDYQSEFDRRVTKALETAKANWEREEQTKQTEAKKLEGMNEEQKAEHKRQQAEKQLAEREAAVTNRELSVHHIIGLRSDYDKRLDDDNLITLCRLHHEQAERGIVKAARLKELAKQPVNADEMLTSVLRSGHDNI